MRLQCSDLNFHLMKRYISDNPYCNCGQNIESPEHYLIHCEVYKDIRAQTIDKLSTEINIQTLLYGNPDYSLELNSKIFRSVADFINRSQRFA